MSNETQEEEINKILSKAPSEPWILKESIDDRFASTILHKPLKPTGRWKLATESNGAIRMFVEHEGFLLNSWIPEHRITFITKELEVIFDCRESGQRRPYIYKGLGA